MLEFRTKATDNFSIYYEWVIVSLKGYDVYKIWSKLIFLAINKMVFYETETFDPLTLLWDLRNTL